MTGLFKKGFVYLVILSSALAGCSEPGQEKVLPFLIKTPLMIITSEDFLEELDLKKAAYPYTINENPAEYNEMVLYLLKMLCEEIILLSAAADIGIIVTDQEVQSAEDEFKKDYPDDSFDQAILKNAVSYSFWKKGFKENMIMEKLIDRELTQKIEITSQDIVEFYNKHTIGDMEASDNKAMVLKKIEDEEELISRLRLQKTQDHYDDWMQELKKKYPVEINKEKLKTFLIDIE